MNRLNTSLFMDMYKSFHHAAYNPLVTHVYSNFTNRHNKYANIKDNQSVAFVGLQYVMMEILVDGWNESFFDQSEEVAIHEYKRVIEGILGEKSDVEHMRKLHQLGYLPIELKAVKEGVFVSYGVPSFTITNTISGFGWVTNALETVLSAELWPICTSATTSAAYRKGFSKWVDAGLAEEMVPFMAHDFSYRGCFGSTAAAMSGFGHLTSFVGSDTIPAALFAEKYYGARIDKELVMASVSATEHSTMTSYGQDNELNSLQHLINNVKPNGILSIVSDSWDFWKLVTEYLPLLKEDIMARDGTVVIRPDSGDPVDILCGNAYLTTTLNGYTEIAMKREGKDVCRLPSGEYYKLGYTENSVISWIAIEGSAENKGLIECLYEIFGGTVLENGNILLDNHIGAIYGDSITLERQKQIGQRLIDKGFVPSVVLGVGSFTYQYVTRDTHGSAMKATDVQLGEGNHMPIFKDPKTDQSKKSAKGLLYVGIDEAGELYLQDDVSPEKEASEDNQLQTVFIDGVITRTTTLNEIREEIKAHL